jgi:hypothetical protein
MASINASIKALLDQSSRQAQNLALNYMIAPIEDALNKALKAAGNLFIDPDEEPLEGGYIDIDTDGPNPDKKKRRHLHTVRPEGTEAKEIKRPTGISFDWCEPEKLEGRAYGWKFSEALMTILLDKTLFTPILEWPPSAKNDHLIKILVGFATHAIEIEFIDNESRLKGVLDKKLIDQFDGWMGEDNRIAPRLYRLFMNNVGRIGAK